MQFQRQITLLGTRGHRKVRTARFAIIGVGSVGCWSALALGSMGAGAVQLLDRDLVDESNLSHQPLYANSELGLPKATAAASKLGALFPATRWEALDTDLSSETISRIRADVILDCTDNLETRYLLNEWAVKKRKKWVHAAAVAERGNIAAFSPKGPCFRCLHPNAVATDTCESAGISPAIAAAVGGLQAERAVCLLLGKKAEGLIHLNKGMQTITIPKNKGCPVCAKREFVLLLKKPSRLITFCGGSVYQAILARPATKKKYERRGPVTLFPDGRALIKAGSQKQARALLARFVPL